MAGEEPPSAPVRRLVEAHPGLHLRELQRQSGLPLGTLRHHLDRLESAGAIRSVREGFFRRYFAAAMARREAAALGALRPAPQRRIAALLLSGGPSTHASLVATTRLPPSSVSLYLRNLVAAGVVVRPPMPGQPYALADALLVARVLRSFRASFLDHLVDHALEIFDDAAASQRPGPPPPGKDGPGAEPSRQRTP